MDIFSDNAWQDWAIAGVIVLIAYMLAVWVAALIWAYRDIASRTREPFVQAVCVLVIAIFNLPGLILYLILRPKETLAERYDRQLEAEALLHEIQESGTCPSCRRRIESEFITCPYCRAELRSKCENCARALAFGWVACPYCGTERAAPARPPRAASSSAPPGAADASSPPSRLRRPSTATYTPPAKPQPPAVDATPDAGA